jgi:hypothetical protein
LNGDPLLIVSIILMMSRCTPRATRAFCFKSCLGWMRIKWVRFIRCLRYSKIKGLLSGGSITEKHPAQLVRQEGQEKGMKKKNLFSLTYDLTPSRTGTSC